MSCYKGRCTQTMLNSFFRYYRFYLALFSHSLQSLYSIYNNQSSPSTWPNEIHQEKKPGLFFHSTACELGDLIILRIFIRISTYSKNSRIFFFFFSVEWLVGNRFMHIFVPQHKINVCTQTPRLQKAVAINRVHVTIFDIVKAPVNIH